MLSGFRAKMIAKVRRAECVPFPLHAFGSLLELIARGHMKPSKFLPRSFAIDPQGITQVSDFERQLNRRERALLGQDSKLVRF